MATFILYPALGCAYVLCGRNLCHEKSPKCKTLLPPMKYTVVVRESHVHRLREYVTNVAFRRKWEKWFHG